jgi:proteasome lid subunit RPN8/RPN11
MPTRFYALESNVLRNTSDARDRFNLYGDYYRSDKGFVADPFELMKIDGDMQTRGERMAGLFHVHIDFPCAPSRLDLDMFLETVPDGKNIWYSILSFLNPMKPEFKIFDISDGLIQELPIEYEG